MGTFLFFNFLGALWVVRTVEMIKWVGLHTVIKSNWVKETGSMQEPWVCTCVRTSVCMSVCICVYKCVHVCAWLCACVHCVHECVHVCVHVSVQACACVCMIVCICVHECVRVCARMSVHKCMLPCSHWSFSLSNTNSTHMISSNQFKIFNA